MTRKRGRRSETEIYGGVISVKTRTGIIIGDISDLPVMWQRGEKKKKRGKPGSPVGGGDGKA